MIQENGKIKVFGPKEDRLVEAKLFERGYKLRTQDGLNFLNAPYIHWYGRDKYIRRSHWDDTFNTNPLHTIADFTDEIKVGDWVMPDAKVLEWAKQYTFGSHNYPHFFPAKVLELAGEMGLPFDPKFPYSFLFPDGRLTIDKAGENIIGHFHKVPAPAEKTQPEEPEKQFAFGDFVVSEDRYKSYVVGGHGSLTYVVEDQEVLKEVERGNPLDIPTIQAIPTSDLELLPSEITVETREGVEVRLKRQYAKFGEVAITADTMTTIAKSWLENFGEDE